MDFNTASNLILFFNMMMLCPFQSGDHVIRTGSLIELLFSCRVGCYRQLALEDFSKIICKFYHHLETIHEQKEPG